jgi:hypothetical protein
MIRACVFFLAKRQRLTQEVDMCLRAWPETPMDGLDLRDALDAADVLQSLNAISVVLERRPRAHPGGSPIRPCLPAARTRAHHVVQGHHRQRHRNRDRDDDLRVVQRQFTGAYQMSSQWKNPPSFVFRSAAPSESFRKRELSIGVSVKLTSIDTMMANAIVQPNGLMKRFVPVHERDRQEDHDERASSP